MAKKIDCTRCKGTGSANASELRSKGGNGCRACDATGIKATA